MSAKVHAGFVALAALVVALSGCSPAGQTKPDAQLTAEADARRAPDLRLVEAITAGDYRRNMVISPYGLHRLFSMLVLGARGRTHDQIVGALGVTDDSDVTPLPLPGFAVRDGMWIDREYTTLPSYEAAIRARFDADVEHVDFSSPDASARIERWVSLATGGQIPRIPLDDVSFVAIDALTYRVKWAQPFEPGNTKPGPFHAEDRTTMTPMMQRQITAAMFSDAQGKYLRLPFTDGNSMLIALPAKGLTASTLSHAIQVSDKQVKPVTVNLTLPRFTVSSHVDLLGPLDRMGMTSSFGRDADYSSIFGRPGVFLTEMYQEGAITVDERGAKMAVVSVAAVDAGPTLLVTFTVDRPFAFVVEDAKTRQVLVAGIVAHP